MAMILGKEYTITTPDVSWPAIAKSHFLELNADVIEGDGEAEWQKLCKRAKLHLELMSKAAIKNGRPIDGDTIIKKGVHWMSGHTHHTHIDFVQLSKTGTFHLMPDGALGISGYLDDKCKPSECVFDEEDPDHYAARDVWFFGENHKKVRGAVWVKVFTGEKSV